jgi:hypothetical protein
VIITRSIAMDDWTGLTPAEIRARVAAAREPALRKFLANCGATVLPGETLEQAVRRVQLVITGVIRHAAETASPNETFQQSGDVPAFVEVGEAGIAVNDAMRHRHCVQLVG